MNVGGNYGLKGTTSLNPLQKGHTHPEAITQHFKFSDSELELKAAF